MTPNPDAAALDIAALSVQPKLDGTLTRITVVLAALITVPAVVAVAAVLQQGRPLTAVAVAIVAAAAVALLVLGSVHLSRAILRPIAEITGAALRHAVLDASTAAAERERMQDAILTEKPRLDTAVNNIAHGVVGIDASMRLVLCNDAYRDIYGLTREAAEPGLPLDGLLRRKARAGTFPGDPDAFIRWMADRKATTGEIELADGRIIRITNRPLAVGGWVSTHEDISAQRNAETAAARTEQLLAAVLDHVPDAIVVKDARDLRYVLVNRAAEALLGIGRDQIVGRTAREVFPPTTAAMIAEDDRAVVVGREPVAVTERAIETPGSGPRIVSARHLPICDRTGEPILLLSAIEDRTDRVRRVTRPLRLAAAR